MQLDGIEIEWFGHATFKIKADMVIYIDPFVVPEGAEKADLILATHEHYDHCDPKKIAGISKENTIVVAPPDCCSKLSGSDVRRIAPGQSMNIGSVQVEAIPSYNIGKQFHPKSNKWVGYVITIKGKKIYHAGDTDLIPEMDGLAAKGIDVALLPVGGTYTMNVDEATEAAKKIKPKIAVPMHYGTLEQTKADPNKFKAELEGSGIKVELMR